MLGSPQPFGIQTQAQIHPPLGQAGIAEGTSYDVSRFHGVLYRTVNTTKSSNVTSLSSDLYAIANAVPEAIVSF